MIRYSNNVQMNYSLNAYLPIEGYRLTADGRRALARSFDTVKRMARGLEPKLERS